MGSQERRFAADMGSLEDIRKFVFSCLADMSTKRKMHVELALEETVVNICSYAYEVPPGELLVRISDDGDRYFLEFEDRGVPFDPLSSDEPDVRAPMEERGQGGLGILLIRRVMDEAHYSREKGVNRLRLVVKKT
ncbi:putative anti-sigma regulatory factor, serine/threonine protein kinase [Dethiosulfovibrio peptidovorans DSM 11002]|uniref:Anti-sigma regulatory factor, serine/threonine protein kinase n=1 Tax=Dethiosulfovibrio peptidovorans DSM 11002 TaxID=469381 RepID=D2Z838_9BACT|nr:ATP-binding protein [Dethiosulfovibrio peptidovorans]EFC91635.1 putative anti-sigma regulatory factor, serine/threonine protein kinase [Dethiosulfovibrio peptidovorans DSM 11002]